MPPRIGKRRTRRYSPIDGRLLHEGAGVTTLERLAIYGVPAFAGVVTALVLLGPGGEREVVGARAWGLCGKGARVCALRLHTVVHYSGAYLSVRRDDLEVLVEQGGRSLGRWTGSTPDSGLVEAMVRFDAPLGASARLRVRQGEDTLAEADFVTVEPLAPRAIAPLATTDAVTVRVPRGTLAPPFPEIVEVSARTPESDEAPRLKAEGVGAELRVVGEPERRCDEASCEHRWRLEAVANAPTAQLEIGVTQGAEELHWRGELPVHNGAMWLDPASVGRGELAIEAPSPRSQAYLSLVTKEGRVWGAIVEMTTDLGGISRGSVPLGELPEGAATLVASSDASAQAGAVGWPLRPELGTIDPPPLLRLVDGMPERVAAETARHQRSRRPAFGLVIAAGLFELLFLWRQNRLSRAQLELHLRGASRNLDAAELRKLSGSMPLLWLSLLAGGLALAFAILAAVAAWA
jgi:hypothetical protein